MESEWVMEKLTQLETKVHYQVCKVELGLTMNT